MIAEWNLFLNSSALGNILSSFIQHVVHVGAEKTGRVSDGLTASRRRILTVWAVLWVDFC